MGERVYEVRETEIFSTWMIGLRDPKTRAKIALRIDRLARGNPGDAEPVGEGISEMRIHYGPGYRVYYTKVGQLIVLLLCGGNKKTQAADIRSAKAMRRRI
jgi:putative addiction module killer protein